MKRRFTLRAVYLTQRYFISETEKNIDGLLFDKKIYLRCLK